MTEDQLEAAQLAYDARGMFPNVGPGRRLGEAAAAAVLVAPVAERGEALDVARDAATYATHLSSALWLRDADTSGWFALDGMDVSEAALRGRSLSSSWSVAAPGRTEDELDREQESDWAAEAERDRIDELEDRGAYGRTLAHAPDAERWIYVRFGRMPKEGKSAFGLMGEDTEDTRDPWREELGGMSTEAGVCVLRAGHHPSVPGAYVVVQPDFSMARYNVPNFEDYLNAIIPRFEEGEEPTVLRIDGSPVVSRAFDRTLRLELGSDGEYLIDMSRPAEVVPLTLADVYVSEGMSVEDFLLERRGYAAPSRPFR
jgi:hypothetical protein